MTRPRGHTGTTSHRKYLRSAGRHWEIDRRKVQEESRYDGTWVLRTNRLDGDAAEIALRYKDLWMVESIFRATKSVLVTRPIYHKCDETIRGHVFCSFLALVLRKEFEERLEAKGLSPEWADALGDLEALRVVMLRTAGATCQLRTMPQGVAGQVLQAAGVALGPSVRFLEE